MSVKLPEMVLHNAITSDAEIVRHVGYRVYPHLAPAVDDLPFINWRRRSIAREQTMAGPMGVPTVTLEYAIFAETYLEARQIADAMRAVLDGFTGRFDNTFVRHTSLDGEDDNVVSLDGSEVPNAYAVTQTYDILWQET
jgi:hypothetical protein